MSGKYLTASGLLNSPRSPQGYPVIAQAGSSKVGRAFAARFAELMFTLQPDFARAKVFYDEMKTMAAEYGRAPDEIKILPSLVLVVADTDEDAEARFDEMDALVSPEVGLELLSVLIHMDLTGHDLDGPLPEVAETELGTKTVQSFFVEKAHRENLTVRELISFMLRWGAIGGSPQTIADYIERWASPSRTWPVRWSCSSMWSCQSFSGGASSSASTAAPPCGRTSDSRAPPTNSPSERSASYELAQAHPHHRWDRCHRCLGSP
jgi:alkanesulfonate monooxygenase SsuD/methylene tetrahydromethanopterin reductase-like flavin-dependent oxidoreductase (luciferase family)